jgi:osmotically-inducible protein OsmY
MNAQYLAARIQHELAENDRTNELGILVEIEEDVVILRGKVANERRRRQVALVAQEVAPDMEIRNDISVVEVKPSEKEERLS